MPHPCQLVKLEEYAAAQRDDQAHRAERTLQEIAQPIRAEHSGQRVEFFIAEVAGNYGDRDGKVAGVLG